MRRGGGGRAGGSDSEDLSYDVHSDDDSSEDDDALFNAALAQTPSPSAARMLARGGRRGTGSSPSPRAPPPTRSLGGPSGKLIAPSNPPPVQMPAGEAGGLGGGGGQRTAGGPAGVPNRAQTREAPPPSRPLASAARAAPPAAAASPRGFRHSSPPRAPGVSGMARQRTHAWDQTPSPENSARNASHVLENELSMGGFSQQVPEHVAAHTVISPVLSQPGTSPDSAVGTPRAGSRSRDRWPLPPLPQRTPPRGRMNGDAGDDSMMSVGADSVVMSDVPGRTTIPQDMRREDLQQLQYERARSKSRDRRRDAREEEGDEENSYVARPYREDDTMGPAHQRIQQRKEAEDKLHDRLMGHLNQLPSRRETELARATRAPIDAPPPRDPAEEEERTPRDVRRALLAAGKASAQGGVVANKSALSPSIGPPPQQAFGLNSSSISAISYDPVQVPLAPQHTVIDRGKPGINGNGNINAAVPGLNAQAPAPRSDVSRTAASVARGETPDTERGEGEKQRTAAAVAAAVAHTEALLNAKLQEVEGAHETEREQLVAQAAEHRERVGELLAMLRQAEATAAEENRFHEQATEVLQRRVAAVEKAGVSLATSLEAMTSERDELRTQLEEKQTGAAALEEEAAALKAMVHDAKDETAAQQRDYAQLDEQTQELIKQVKHMEELQTEVQAEYEGAMASSRELEARLRDVQKERDDLLRDLESGKRHADDQGNSLRCVCVCSLSRARVRACVLSLCILLHLPKRTHTSARTQAHTHEHTRTHTHIPLEEI
jgi:hypothetical protein